MKYLKYICVLSLVAVFGCKKTYLEERPTEKLSTEQLQDAAKLDTTLLAGNVAGLYATMYTVASGGLQGRDDDIGQKGFDIYSDMLCSDMVLTATNYGWYTPIARYQNTVINSSNENYMGWRYYYRIIFSSNILIDALGGTNTTPVGENNKYFMGQAKAMRAYGYYYLTQLYAKGYNESEKILPIYTDTKVPNQPKATTKEVYDLMVKDLEEAIVLLDGFSRDSKSAVNKYVAEGLLAYVLAARGTQADLQKVVTLTNDVMKNGGFPLTTKEALVANLDSRGKLLNPQSGFNNVNTASWMWGTDITLAMGLDLASWWGQIDIFTYSYAWAGDTKVIDNGLYAKIKNDDIRKKQFDADDLTPTGKFFAPDRKIGGQRNITADYIYMRVEEMYFLNAEANAKLGNETAAKETLKKVLDIRITDDSYLNSLSGDALKDEIYLQTRIEFWGEGKSYLAMKRNKATITRGTNHLYFKGASFKWDDPKLTFSIPQNEELNNPNLNK